MVDNRHIQLVLKEDVTDVLGLKVARDAKKYLRIDTGRVKTGKIFTIALPLTRAEIEELANLGLRDEVLHEVWIDRFYQHRDYRSYVLVSKLPGVTDDEGISAQRTLADLVNQPMDTSVQHIFTQEIFLIERRLDDRTLHRLAEDLLGNRLIHHFEWGTFEGRVDYLPEVHIRTDPTSETIDIFVGDEELQRISRERVLSLDLAEMKAIQAYYRRSDIASNRLRLGLPETPTDCELEVLAQTWSEHCKHKEFNAIIEYRDLTTGRTEVIDSLFETYIRGSTEVIRRRLEAHGNHWLVKVFSDNAGVVRIDDDRLFVWKVETHNSPSALDPYGGAITGILGNNRDPLGTGRGGGRLLFNTDVLCFGPPDYRSPLLTGQLHPLRVFEGVRHGIQDGGNKSGVPTVNGSLLFDDRFSGKPLVFCGTGSVLPARYGDRNSWEKEIADGDRILMAGGRVGKDGIHGATFSSAEIDEHSPHSAVQVGSPITQKLLSDLLEVATRRGLVKCATDNGAGGLSSSVGELAVLCGGAEVHLERVPLKYSGLKPWEIFVSESQERMTLVVEPDCVEELLELARLYEVEVTDVGRFTSSKALDVRYQGRPVAFLEMDFLHRGVPRKRLEAWWEPPRASEPELPPTQDWGEVLTRLLSSPNLCSRERIVRQYDHEVKGKTVVKPLMGARGVAPQDAAVLRLDLDGWVGVAVSNGIAPRYGDLDPYEMSAGAFDEAVRQIIAVGGRLPDPARTGNHFWSVNDNFCMPDSAYDPDSNPDGRLKLAKLVRMCQALFDMATFFDIPMTSGKDSMKNDFRADGRKISIPPTILYSMVARIEDVRRAVTSDYKGVGDLVVQLGRSYDELGGSEFYQLFGELGANVPRVRMQEARRLYHKVARANERGWLESCHDISNGGLAVALVEPLFGSELGLAVEIPPSDLTTAAELFSESHSRFVASVRPANREAIEELFAEDCRWLGEVTGSRQVRIQREGATLVDLPVAVLERAFRSGLEF